MDFLTFSLLIFSFICTAILISNSRTQKSCKFPPGPYGLPIIGNILHLGPKPHQSLTKLSRKYGPVMSLKLGRVTTVVVSSPETARMVMQKHDLSFSSRSIPCAAEALNHGEFSVGWLPVGNQWRKLRKVLREQIFSVPRLDAGQALRRDKVQKFYEYVRACSETGRAVNVGEAAFKTTLNLISSALFSVDFAPFDSDSSQEMRDLVWGVIKCLGTPNLADFFPVLKSVDPQGLRRQVALHWGKLFAKFDEIIKERLKSTTANNDFLDALLDLHKSDGRELSRNDIFHLLADLIVAGTETTSSTVEWAMAELMRSPTKMSRLRDEIRDRVIQEIHESDFPQFPYLQAVIKETLRLHPSAPFLLPRKAQSDVEVNGYVVPKNSQILVNVWASGRDPRIWTDPDSFEPERFLNKDHDHVDFRGQDFELIPFGAGRRICPGLPLAHRMLQLMLVMLVGNFEWRIEGGMEVGEISMDEKFGVTLQKAVPLKAVPTKL